MPNWLEPWLLAVWLDNAVIVFSPEVRVAPLTVMEYPLAALVAADIVEVPLPVVAVVRVPSATVAEANVNVNVSSTLAVTVICPAVEAATVPESTEVVHASSEYVVILAKKVLLVALGLVTAPNTTVWLPVGAAELPVFFMRSFPAVEVLTLQPEASPKLVGCDDNVDDALLNPLGVLHAPLAVVQITASKDCKTVDEGTVNVNV